MKIYALVGKSGTGKSHNAITLCGERGIGYIIDDGLFIGRSGVIAGKSAKREQTAMGAIKAAIFNDDSHADEVRRAIADEDPENILVIGTSIKMVNQICDRLEIPEPAEIIKIEDITTAAERYIAAKKRNEYGNHVIPAPTMQLKRQFSGYMLSPLKLWHLLPQKKAERTVVRPTYSYLGEFYISDRVMSDIVRRVAGRNCKVTRVITTKDDTGIRMDILLVMNAGERMMDLVKQLQRDVTERVEKMTSFNVRACNVEIRALK